MSNQVTITVDSYDEQFDTFAITRIEDGYRSLIPGFLVPVVIGEYGEPSELVGRIFAILPPQATQRGLDAYVGILDENGDVHEAEDVFAAYGKESAVVRIKVGEGDGFQMDVPLEAVMHPKNYKRSL